MKFILMAILFVCIGNAQEKKLKVTQSKQLKLSYKMNAWNRNSSLEDAGSLLLRDAATGKLARVELQETGPNTGEFLGYYSISFGSEDTTPEIYIPPQEMVKSAEKMKALDSLIKDGLLLRKPFFLRPEKSYQAITVFDSKDQALQAYEQYRTNLNGKPIVSQSVLDAQQKAAQLAEQKKLSDLAMKQELERIRMAELEKARQEELLRQQQLLSAAEKAKRKREAESIAQEAMVAYRAQDFPKAEDLFKKSQELDPENTSYNFQYGVTLYKNQKYNASVVSLGLAQGLAEQQALEKNYYLGLNYLKLKEFDTAHDILDKVKAADNKEISPAASFFNGIIDFQKEKYDIAKKYFEYTLDNSNDPKMDEQAENYIEQIAQIKMFEANKAKKFLLSASVGTIYDSNVLLVQDGGEPTAESGKAGLRLMYSLTGEYRPIYTESHELSATLTYSDMYTNSTSLKSDATFSNADPNTISFTIPYKYKGKFLNKGFQQSVTTGYDTTYLNADQKGSREAILNSPYLKSDSTFVMSEDWFSTYTLEYRKDISLSKVAVGDEDNDTSATKMTLGTSQIRFEDKKKTQAKIYDGSYILNQAVGDNKKYTKLSLGFSQLMPWKWDTSVIGKVDMSYANYASSEDSRKDTAYGLTGTVIKPINKTWSSMGSFNYTVNGSNSSSNKYSKYALTILASYTM